MEKRAPKIFIVVPLHSAYDLLRSAITDAIKAASGTLGRTLDVMYIGAFETSSDIESAVREEVSRSDLIIADVTAASGRLNWQLGSAHAEGKTLLLLTADVDAVPTGMRGVRVIVYESSDRTYSLVRTRITEAVVGVFDTSQRQATAKAIGDARQVFVSYSHADAEFLNRILIHLRPLERKGLINLWSDTKLQAGVRWKEEIRVALENARCAILLVSADFLSSEFINTQELPPLLRAARECGTRIIPIILKPCLYLKEDDLGEFQALNDPANPVIRMNEFEREQLYVKLAETIAADFSI